jgi:hypothetical protein
MSMDISFHNVVAVTSSVREFKVGEFEADHEFKRLRIVAKDDNGNEMDINLFIKEGSEATIIQEKE